MTGTAKVKKLLYAQDVDMGGFPVKQPFPATKVENIDPFLLLHHANTRIPEGAVPRKSGIGPHPHRGFSPVTFVFKGGVHHRDSRGNSAVVYEGGVQWMEAGMGIIHSERPPEDIFDRGGEQEIIQLWINTPAALKMNQPKYFNIKKEDIPEIRENGTTIGVVAGEILRKKGPVNSQIPIIAARFHLNKGATLELDLPTGRNSFIYAIQGLYKIKGHGLVEDLNLVHFEPEGGKLILEAVEETTGIFLSGKPINEKVVKHGPFVMNSQTQILQAMADYQQGKMGILIED